MLAMAVIHYIKHLREREGLHVNEIANKLKINWRTAKKYADRDNWNESPKVNTRRFPSLEPYQDIVDAWLLEDKTKPRKQRHTAKAIFERLKHEHGYKGSDRTVRDFVKSRKEALQVEQSKSSARLTHPGGEAQVDFGTIQAIINKHTVELKLLVLSFPYSNAAFVHVVPGENIECFLEGMKRIFEQIGGVPTTIWFDNLSAAVVAIQEGGKRKLTKAFENFCLHYRFEARFCNPARGNEKGHVENKVGYTRRNWCVPVPIVSNLEELQAHLTLKAKEDMNRPHYKHQDVIKDLWEMEVKKLLTLPLTPFDAIRLDSVKVNKYQEIKVDNRWVPLSGVHPGDTLLLKIGWKRIEVLDRQYRKVSTIPRPYPYEPLPLDWKAQLEPFKNKPRAVPYASVMKLLPESVHTYLLGVEGKERRDRLSWLLRMLHHYSMDAIGQVLKKYRSQHLEPTLLEHALYSQTHPQLNIVSLSESYTPTHFHGYDPDPSQYDRLYRGEVSP